MKVLVVIGFIVIGYIIPEFFVALSPKNIKAPLAQNIFTSVALGLISAGMIL